MGFAGRIDAENRLAWKRRRLRGRISSGIAIFDPAGAAPWRI
jgi:hypothetical protein